MYVPIDSLDAESLRAGPSFTKRDFDLTPELENHVSVITGGASGIGREIANHFLAAGSRVVLIDVDSSVTQVAKELEAQHDKEVMPIEADVSDAEAMREVGGATIRQWNRCDHLVCAAAIGSGKFGAPFWKLDVTDWDDVLRVNIMGVVNLAHVIAPEMAKAGRGSILMISSVAGQIGSPTDPPYSASKAALINFAQCAAKDLAPHNVRVNTICPGMIKTPLNRAVWRSWLEGQAESERMSYDEWAQDKIKNVTPLGRWQQPDDIAAMALFLASSRAGNVTGQTINVDGGQVMHW